MKIQFNANKRELQGTSASRRLRRSGRVPGILYGGEVQAQSIDLDHNEIFQHLRKETFYSSVLTMSLGGAEHMCLLRDVQRHPYRMQILHVDFQRIDAAHEIHQKVPLHFINADIAPGVKVGGGMVQHIMTELNVKCLPKDLPAFIEVDLKDMEASTSMHVLQLTMPAGVVPVLHKGEDPVIATIVVRGGGAAEEPEAAAPAETQITTEKKPAAAAAEKKPEKK